MTDLEVNISRTDKLERIIESLFRKAGLSITLKGTSAKFAGSIHWHLKKGKERGTLEATLWPAQKKLWFSMQDGRAAEWVMDSAYRLKQQVESQFK